MVLGRVWGEDGGRNGEVKGGVRLGSWGRVGWGWSGKMLRRWGGGVSKWGCGIRGWLLRKRGKWERWGGGKIR